VNGKPTYSYHRTLEESRPLNCMKVTVV